MPQRTNPFQQLVALVKRAYANQGDTITESAMVKVFGFKKKREIDILHETSVGLFTIKIAVEAKDEGRPMDLNRFEALVGRYFGPHSVNVQKLVVVTRNGFTEDVVTKAKLSGTQLDVHLHAINATAPIECTPYEMTDGEGKKRLLQHATSVVGNKKISWVMPDGLTPNRSPSK